MYYSDDHLYHHGILGQEWGVRNGPPYPLGSGDHSAKEKLYKNLKKKSANNKKESTNNKKSSTNNEKERSNKEVANILGISEEQAAKIKKTCKILGISLATTAGLVAAGYLISTKMKNKSTSLDPLDAVTKDLKNIFRSTEGDLDSLTDEQWDKLNDKMDKLYQLKAEKINQWLQDSYDDLDTEAVSEGKNAVRDIIDSVNVNKSSNVTEAFKLDDKDLFIGNVIGNEAWDHGYRTIDSGYLRYALTHKQAYPNSYEHLVEDMRLGQIAFGSSRRLSCWSASQAFFLSSLTGHEFCSMSFENLVDFNDFGSLYKTKPKIFNVFGEEASDFVGKFGNIKGNEGRTSRSAGVSLVQSIFENVSSSNNLTTDGRTIGFINAGYTNLGCTHQWNFEIIRGKETHKDYRLLRMVDCYSGESYAVATQRISDGLVEFAPGDNRGFSKLMNELNSYNEDSIRFYAPSLDSINLDNISKVVLGRYNTNS